MKSAALVLAALIFVLPAQARAEDERSAAWAYGIASAAVLLPAWAATAALPTDGEDFEWSPRFVAALTGFYASAAWGPSAGYYYSGNHRYATLSGLGKTGLLAGGLAASRAFEGEGQHPYILGLTVISVTLWGAVDFALLYRDVRKQNQRRASASAAVPLAGGRRGLGLPTLSISESSIALSVGGQF